MLDGGLAGALVLYGMPPGAAAAAVLVYHTRERGYRPGLGIRWLRSAGG